MIVVLHVVHGGFVVVGFVVVLWLLGAPRVQTRRVAALRRAVARDRLVADAHARALRQLDPAGRSSVALGVAAVATVVSSCIHAAVSPEHFAEGVRFGVFFTVLSLVQIAGAVALVARPTRRLVLATVLLNTGVIALWALTRTYGLPFGLGEVEEVGLADLASVAAELVVLGCCARWLRRAAATQRIVRPARRAAAIAGRL